MPRAGSGGHGDGASATAPATSARGTSCSSAGSTTRPSCPASGTTRDARPGRRPTAPRPQAVVVKLPDAGRSPPSATRPSPASTSGGAATATTSNNTLTRAIDLTGADGGVADRQGPVRHRGRLRLPLRRGLHRRRRQPGRPLATTGRRRGRDRHRRLDHRQLGRPDASTCRRTPARPCSCGSATRPTAACTSTALPGRHRRSSRTAPLDRRRRGAASAAGRRRLHALRPARSPTSTAALLHRGEPARTRVRRRRCKTGPYNFGCGLRAAGLRGALPVPGRPAGLVRQLRVRRQQHVAAPGRRDGAAR